MTTHEDTAARRDAWERAKAAHIEADKAWIGGETAEEESAQIAAAGQASENLILTPAPDCAALAYKLALLLNLSDDPEQRAQAIAAIHIEGGWDEKGLLACYQDALALEAARPARDPEWDAAAQAWREADAALEVEISSEGDSRATWEAWEGRMNDMLRLIPPTAEGLALQVEIVTREAVNIDVDNLEARTHWLGDRPITGESLRSDSATLEPGQGIAGGMALLMRNALALAERERA